MTFLEYLLSGFLNGLYLMALGLLPYILLAFFMQFMSMSMRMGIAKGKLGTLLLYLTAPGVIIHELGHVLFCLIFGHKVLEVKFFENDPDRNRLGYVNHRYNPASFYQRIGNFFIGTGPIWFGVGCIFLFSILLLPSGMIGIGEDLPELLKNFFSGFLSGDFWLSWKTWLWFYLSFSITVHITLSKSDFVGAWDGLFLVIGLVFLCSLLLGWCGSWEETLLKHEFHVLMTLLSIMLAFFICFIVPILIIRFFVHRSKKKKAETVIEKEQRL